MEDRHTTVFSNEFRDRVVELCLEFQSALLPSAGRDRHILLKSVTMTLDPHRALSADEFNAALDRWMWIVGQRLEADRSALRRALVTEKYVSLDAARRFRVAPRKRAQGVRFAATVDKIDVFDVALHGMCALEQRRRDRFPKPGRRDGKKLVKARMVARWLALGVWDVYDGCRELAGYYDPGRPFLSDLRAFHDALDVVGVDENLAKRLAKAFLDKSDEWVRWL